MSVTRLDTARKTSPDMETDDCAMTVPVRLTHVTEVWVSPWGCKILDWMYLSIASQAFVTASGLAAAASPKEEEGEYDLGVDCGEPEISNDLFVGRRGLIE
jgi:hypothetical protein